MTDCLALKRPDGGWDIADSVKLSLDFGGWFEYQTEFETLPAHLKQDKKLKYIAEHDEVPIGDEAPDLYEDGKRSWPPVVIQGQIRGILFHAVDPRTFVSMPVHDDRPVEVDFRPITRSYERFGAMECRNGEWRQLATTGIASPSRVRRASEKPEREVDLDRTARSRCRNYWCPTENEHVSPRSEVRDLLCILPQETSDQQIAKLAAEYLHVDQSVVLDAIPSIREDLKNGDIGKPEVLQSHGEIWRYSPDWVDSDSEGVGDNEK